MVERCAHPRNISKLVIVPKLAPGQSKDGPSELRECVDKQMFKAMCQHYSFSN